MNVGRLRAFPLIESRCIYDDKTSLRHIYFHEKQVSSIISCWGRLSCKNLAQNCVASTRTTLCGSCVVWVHDCKVVNNWDWMVVTDIKNTSHVKTQMLVQKLVQNCVASTKTTLLDFELVTPSLFQKWRSKQLTIQKVINNPKSYF